MKYREGMTKEEEVALLREIEEQERGMECGTCRNIRFVTERDGAEAGVAFAEQAVRAYRKAVREKRGRMARTGMIEAYLCAKRRARKPQNSSLVLPLKER